MKIKTTFFSPAVLLLMLAVLNTLDWVTTVHGVHNGAHEANPLMNQLIEAGQFTPFKLTATAFFVFVGIYIEKRWKHLKDHRLLRAVLIAVLIILVMFYIVVVINNIYQLGRSVTKIFK